MKLGQTIFNAVQKSRPYLLDGTISMAKNTKFSIKNPYILEVLPDNTINSLSIFEGKKLRTVCRILDDANYSEILKRYKTFTSKSNVGFSAQEISQLNNKAFPNKVPWPVNYEMSIYLKDLDPKIAFHIDAHGIAKDDIPLQLKSLNDFLSKGIDKNKKIHTAPLAVPKEYLSGGSGLGSAGGHAYYDGSFIITSGKGKTLLNNGIENVIVNDAYYNIIDDLRNKFPNIKFLRADEAVSFFNSL